MPECDVSEWNTVRSPDIQAIRTLLFTFNLHYSMMFEITAQAA
jgi:hypothetical protein